jgi:hypothetical protein
MFQHKIYQTISLFVYIATIVANVTWMVICESNRSMIYYISPTMTVIAIFCFFIMLNPYCNNMESTDMIFTRTYVFFMMISFMISFFSLMVFIDDCMIYASCSWIVMVIFIFPVLPFLMIVCNNLCDLYFVCSSNICYLCTTTKNDESNKLLNSSDMV